MESLHGRIRGAGACAVVTPHGQEYPAQDPVHPMTGMLFHVAADAPDIFQRVDSVQLVLVSTSGTSAERFSHIAAGSSRCICLMK